MTEPERNLSRDALVRQLVQECYAMLRYSMTTGLQLPAGVIQAVKDLRLGAAEDADWTVLSDLSEQQLQGIMIAHNELASTVSPAKPGSIALLTQESMSRSPLRFLGAVGLVRRLMIVAVTSLALFVGLSLFPEVGAELKHFHVGMSSGLTLLLNELFLMAAASLGASFSNLYVVHYYVKEGTFDPARESDYWIRQVLGVLGGTMLPLLSLSVDTSSSPATEIATGTLGPPTLALLGGFSASVVYQILTRMASAVESMFHGDMRTRMSVAEQAWKTRQQEQLVQQKVDMAMRVNAVLVVTSHGDIAVVQRELERLQTDLLSSRPTLGGSAPNRSAVDS